jgi:hypothetical protein
MMLKFTKRCDGVSEPTCPLCGLQIMERNTFFLLNEEEEGEDKNVLISACPECGAEVTIELDVLPKGKYQFNCSAME